VQRSLCFRYFIIQRQPVESIKTSGFNGDLPGDNGCVIRILVDEDASGLGRPLALRPGTLWVAAGILRVVPGAGNPLGVAPVRAGVLRLSCYGALQEFSTRLARGTRG